MARVVDNEHKRDYLGLLAELHDTNNTFKLFAPQLSRWILETTNTGISGARSCEKSPCEHRVR